MFASGAPKDAALLTGGAAWRGRISASGKTIRDPRISGEPTGVFIIAGQSLAGNSNGALYTPTSPKVDNLSVFDGTVYAAADPLIGCGGLLGNWGSRLGDKLIAAAKYQRVVLVPIAVGGSPLAEWLPGAELYPLFAAAFQRCIEKGYPVTAVLWQHGEFDALAGVSTASYAAGLNSIISSVRSSGIAAPWYVARSSYIGGVTDPDIQAAVASVVDGVSIFAGADTDSLGEAYRMDSTHLNASGCDANASMWTAVL